MTLSFDDLEYIGMGPSCPKCGQSTDWLPCWDCGGDGYHDDLYEQDPLWYDEGDIEICYTCHEKGGWWRCDSCQDCFDDLKDDGPEVRK